MRIEHSFDIYAKLYMPTHLFEFYVSFFFYVLVTCSVLWCVVCVILRCGKLSVRLSQPLRARFITLVLYQMIRNTYCLWLPNFQGNMANLKKPSETGQIQGFRVFSGERIGERPKIPFAAVSWPPNYILITVCWFYWFWWHFDSTKHFKCVVSVFDGERMTVMA